MSRIFFGIAAGLLGAVADLVITYVVGVVIMAATTREFFATVLAAITVWPFMLLFVLLVPTILVGVLVGLTIGVTDKVGSRTYVIGAVAGVLFGIALLSGVLPVIVERHSGDFTSIISRPALAGVYGLILGLVASLIFKTNVTSRH